MPAYFLKHHHIFDKEYYSQIYSDGTIRFGNPRNATLTLRAKF